ncbi:YwqG family protein [Paenibacillus dokdonensis]|uniref:YwqG family protein n=1 Tax=Paenibacillus dokdonensis TaxID=2567944 RepID=UPI0010A80A4F|nr:YwqG family protein [Paenibacillus dokdonensis]
MRRSEQSRNKLEQVILEHQFEHASAYLLENTRQGIRCAKAGAANYDIPCVSRIGGDPDLPPQAEWPATTDGTPMTFLVQLNLKDVASHDESSLLPTGGMLYFFVGIDDPAYHIQHRVLFLPDDQLASAERRLSPEGTALEGRFCGYQLEARTSLEPPNYAYVDYEQIENESVGYEEYEDLTFSLSNTQRDDAALLFGYPTGQHDDSEYEAALMILTGQNYSYSTTKAFEQLTAHFAGNEEKAKQEIQDTLMLLEIESDDDVGFCWWDAGVLHFFIRKEDLLAGRFDRTYCSLYSS